MSGSFRLIAGFFRLFFKLFFYKILVKIYFQVFRFKKNNLKEKTSSQLIRSNSVFIIITVLGIFFIISNTNSKGKTNTMDSLIPKTIMANLVKNEFSSLESEELIEESYTPSSLKAAGKEKYLDSFSTIEKQAGLVNITEDEQYNSLVIVNEDGLAIKPRIIGSNLANDGIIPQRNEIIYYTVQKGDVVSNIARKFDITVNTILWSNNLTAFSLIRPGDTLTILPYSGVVHTVKSGDTISKIANLYDVEAEKILSSNNVGGSLKIGDKIIVPGGRKIATAVATTRRTNNGSTGLSIIRDLVKSPNENSSPTGAKMAWPTVGHRITQYYSWRHTGLDVANKVGTPLYAVESGTVEFAGWSNGYGYNVVINHGGGKKTRYAHASKLFVKVGDEVSRGENIAAMGSTGWSTGPHIHFEVMINGKKYNPLNYIK
jgi:murein DD-endopeptidase MepM/ murein hydrolase activator NlpD